MRHAIAIADWMIQNAGSNYVIGFYIQSLFMKRSEKNYTIYAFGFFFLSSFCDIGAYVCTMVNGMLIWLLA